MTYRGVSSAITTNGVATATLPAGLVVGDLMLAFVGHELSTATMTTPAAGWTALQADLTASDFSVGLFYRHYQSGDTAPSWTWSAAGETLTDIVAYGNAGTPAYTSAIAGTGANNVISATITPSAANTLLVCYAGTDISLTGRNWTVSDGMTERLDAFTGTWSHRVLADQVLSDAAGVATSRTCTLSGTVQANAIFLLAIPITAAAGSGTGSAAWTGNASGVAPTVDVSSGSATGAIEWLGSTAGAKLVQGSATGSASWSATTSGKRVPKATVTGADAWAGTSAGAAPVPGGKSGYATGTMDFACTARSAASGVRFRGVSSVTTTDGVATATLPAGLAVGDLMLAFVGHEMSTATMTTPAAGWTALQTDLTAQDFSVGLFYRHYQSGDVAPTWVWSAVGATLTDIVAYGNAGTPDFASTVTPTTAANVISATITPAEPDTLLVGYAATDISLTGRNWTVSGGMTERLDAFTGPYSHRVLADQLLPSSVGVATSRTFTLSGSAQANALFLLAIPPASAAPANLAQSRWVGVPSATAVTVAVVTQGATAGEPIRLKVSTTSDLTTSPIYSSTVTPDADHVAKLTATGLTAGTTYYYGVEQGGVVDTASVGSFKTAPSGAGNFSFVFGSCQDRPEGSAWTRAKSRNPDLCLITGDLSYWNITSNSQSLFRQGYNDLLAMDSVAAMLANVPTVYTWSDHDFGVEDADTDSPSKPAAQAVYRQYVPHPTLPDAGGIYHTFSYGRVRFIVTDERSFMSPVSVPDSSSKTILGATQKQWFKDTIAAATEPLIVWVGDSAWIGPPATNVDGWRGCATERAELGSFIDASGRLVVRIGGDGHALGADDGTNAVGGLAVLQAAPWSNYTLPLPGTYSHGAYPLSGVTLESMYGHCQVIDDGTDVTLTFTGYDTNEVAQVTMTVASSESVGAGSGATSWTGTATGKRVSQGATTPGVLWTATTATTRVSRGVATAAAGWGGTASGRTVMRGAATGADTWSATTSGRRAPYAISTGAAAWTATTTGKKPTRGAATGAHTWGAYAPGAEPSYGTVAGSTTWAGTATGRTVKRGQAVAANHWTGAAASSDGQLGSGVGTQHWTGVATGKRVAKGATGAAATAWTGTCLGRAAHRGSTTGTHAWEGTGASPGIRSGTASGALTWGCTSQGRRASRGRASRTVKWVGRAGTGVIIHVDVTVGVGTTRVGTVAVSTARVGSVEVDATRNDTATVQVTRQGWTVAETKRDRGT